MRERDRVSVSCTAYGEGGVWSCSALQALGMGAGQRQTMWSWQVDCSRGPLLATGLTLESVYV